MSLNIWAHLTSRWDALRWDRLRAIRAPLCFLESWPLESSSFICNLHWQELVGVARNTQPVDCWPTEFGSEQGTRDLPRVRASQM